MSIVRFNELRGEQVVYAVDRQERTFLPPRDHCPLCPTLPGSAPTEIPLPAYEIVVFDNLFPAFEAPHGAAEVVVYTDQHDASFATLEPGRVRDLMWVWQDRYRALSARDDVKYVYIFENRGVEVGVTLHHPHGQIYGYPFVPPVPRLEVAADARLGGCAVCANNARELEQQERVLIERAAALAYVPLAARWPYEVHVAMREHRACLLDCSASELDDLADTLQTMARGYDALFARAFPYVMAVHQAPCDGVSDGHLHVEFYPPLRTADKLKFLAGSEQGAGTFISDVLPEAAASALREAIERAG
jgi:UDPglucose--hexose-1-phosphate uridylyltransferase